MNESLKDRVQEIRRRLKVTAYDYDHEQRILALERAFEMLLEVLEDEGR